MQRVPFDDITHRLDRPSDAVRRSSKASDRSFNAANPSPMFSKCPQCGASILDDTEELCPSCDQPLKGGAKAKPKAAPAKAAPAKAAPTAKPAEPAKKPAAAAKSEAPRKATSIKPEDVGDDDDPFDIGGQSGKQATRVHPKPAKGRMYRVQCPMCESPGFVPQSAAGEEVRCWNKECRLPLYKAPAIEKEPEPEPEVKKKPIAAILFGLIVVGGGAAGAYFAMNPGEEEKVIKPIDPTTITTDPEQNDGPGSLIAVDPNANKGPKVTTTADLIGIVLKALPRQVTDPGNGAQADSNRLAAEAYTLTGDAAKADQMLAAIPGSAVFYQIRPLVLRANAALSAGDKAAADAVATTALQHAAKLPPAGREALDWATDLAILLVRLDRSDEAATLINKYHDAGIRGEYSALLAGARNSGTFDLADLAGATLIQNTPNPQWVAVTRGLVSLGERDAALAWAKKGPGSVGADALVAWAGTLSANETLDPAAIEKEASSPTLAARLLAAAGLEAYTQSMTAAPVKADAAETESPEGNDAATEAGDAAAAPVSPLASSLLAAAVAKLPTEPVTAMTVPTLRQFYDSASRSNAGLANADEVRTEALAFMKVAELQFALDQSDEAWATLKNGLERLRSYAPGPIPMQQVVDAYDQQRNAVRSQLESELNLDTRNKVNSAFNRYRRQVDEFKAASDVRFALQERLARVAIDNAAESALVDWMEAAADEPWWSSSVAGELVKSTDAAIASRAKGLVTGTLPTSPEPWRRIVTEAVESGNIVPLAQKLRNLRKDLHTQGLWAGVTASLLVRKQDDQGLKNFVEYLTDPGVRADVIEMAIAQAVRRGTGVSLYETLAAPGTKIKPQEKVALYRGVCVGDK